MDEVRKNFYAKLADQVIKKLKKRRMDADYAATGREALERVMGMIPANASVYRSGSMTLVELGIIDAINARSDLTIIDPFRPGLSREESLEERRRGMLADIMVASTNAITLDGKLVNLDGMGNRVAGMTFGPKKVILVTSVHKVVKDVDEAMKRVQHWAAPVNNIRLNLDNPCVEAGVCVDCKSASRICNVWTIIEGQMIENRIHVLLVGEPCGY